MCSLQQFTYFQVSDSTQFKLLNIACTSAIQYVCLQNNKLYWPGIMQYIPAGVQYNTYNTNKENQTFDSIFLYLVQKY